MPTPITSRIDNPSMVAIERIFAILFNAGEHGVGLGHGR